MVDLKFSTRVGNLAYAIENNNPQGARQESLGITLDLLHAQVAGGNPVNFDAWIKELPQLIEEKMKEAM